MGLQEVQQQQATQRTVPHATQQPPPPQPPQNVHLQPVRVGQALGERLHPSTTGGKAAVTGGESALREPAPPVPFAARPALNSRPTLRSADSLNKKAPTPPATPLVQSSAHLVVG